MGNLGSSDVDSRLEEQLIDGILYAFQEQTQEVNIFLIHWGAIVVIQHLTRISRYFEMIELLTVLSTQTLDHKMPTVNQPTITQEQCSKVKL